MNERPRVLVELGEELDRVAREALPSESTTATRTAAIRRRWRWRAVPVVLLVALGGAAAALASGLISLGAPAKPTPVLSNPRAGLGALTPGTVTLLPIATPDTQGGPPWGLRVLSTTRGAGCVQVARLVDGKLVALGQDGAFSDDGRAHALPLSTATNSFSCTPLDGKGQFFNSVTMVGQTASAAWWFRATSCVPTGTPRAANPAHPACPQKDERNLYYGLLGPDAKSITYTLSGQTHTQATVGPQGAYLIVTASDHQRIPGSGGGIAGDPSGDVYYISGNGTFDANTGGPDYGDSMVKLNGSLQVQDYFTPYNQLCLSQGDVDLGAGGPLVIPSDNVVISAGKEGRPYVVNTTNMGKYTADPNLVCGGTDSNVTTIDKVQQELPPGTVGSLFSTPTLYTTSTGAQDIYFSPGDAGRFFACAVEAPDTVRHATVYAASRPIHRERFDLSEAAGLLGYHPQESWPQGIEVVVE